jgi:hypothetical protein
VLNRPSDGVDPIGRRPRYVEPSPLNYSKLRCNDARREVDLDRACTGRSESRNRLSVGAPRASHARPASLFLLGTARFVAVVSFKGAGMRGIDGRSYATQRVGAGTTC